MTRTTAHLISHTYWDREWYMPYERHHVLLAKLAYLAGGQAYPHQLLTYVWK
ncbi:hypothetical protein D3C76_256970 [compost metagenome]